MKRGKRITCLLAMLMIAVMSLNVIVLQAALLPSPTETATKQRVLEVVKANNNDVYYILSTQSERGSDFMVWYNGGSIVSELDTATHETYHSYTHSGVSGYLTENIYAGNGKIYKVDFSNLYNKMFPSSEMSQYIPEELRTFRYKTYVSATNNTNTSANINGIYGLINEFTAYYWGLNVMTSLIPYFMESDAEYEAWKEYVLSVTNNMTAYAEFKFWMLRYMMYAKEAHPDVYQAILDNEAFREAYTDMEQKYAALIAENIGKIDGINAFLNAQGKGVRIKYTSDAMYCYKGSSGSGNRLKDYNILMDEMGKAEYVEMDKLIKNGEKTEAIFRPGEDFLIPVYDGVDYSAVFDAEYYAKVNPDVPAVLGNDYNTLLWHFVNYGMAEGRLASENFNVVKYAYCLLNDDLRAAYGGDMKQYYLHYIRQGRFEGRSTSDWDSIFDAKYYLESNPDVKSYLIGKFGDCGNLYGWCLWHYCEFGAFEGRLANEKFSVLSYAAVNGDVFREYSRYNVDGTISTDFKAIAVQYLQFGNPEGRPIIGRYNMNALPTLRPDVVQVYGINNLSGWCDWYINFGQYE